MSLIQHFLDVSTTHPSITELLPQFLYQWINLWSADLKYSKYWKTYQRCGYVKRRQIRFPAKEKELYSHKHVTSHAGMAIPHLLDTQNHARESTAYPHTNTRPFACTGTGPTHLWQKTPVVCQTELSLHIEQKST